MHRHRHRQVYRRKQGHRHRRGYRRKQGHRHSLGDRHRQAQAGAHTRMPGRGPGSWVITAGL